MNIDVADVWIFVVDPVMESLSLREAYIAILSFDC